MSVPLPLHDPAQWPLRMTREQVAAVHQRSVSWLRARVAAHRFPRPDSDGRWCRDVVRRYAEGGIKEFDRAAEKRERAAARTGRRGATVLPLHQSA